MQRSNYSKFKRKGGISWFLIGTACGSLLTYFFDSTRGHSRRIIFKDKGIKLRREGERFFSKQWRNIKNQYIGLRARSRSINEEKVSDDILLARVRSKFGRAVTHAKAVRVDVKDGVVTLSGPVLPKELKEILSKVRKVKGVKQVISHLDPRSEFAHIPELQGTGPQYLQ